MVAATTNALVISVIAVRAVVLTVLLLKLCDRPANRRS